MNPRKTRTALALLAALPLQPWAHGLDCLAPHGRGPGGTPQLLEPTSVADPSPAAADVITLAMLPDIQYYTKCQLPHLVAQTQWLAAQSAVRNIRAALFMGDLTEHNIPAEWRFVRDQLAWAQAQVPLLLAVGNHDMGYKGYARGRRTGLGKFFPSPPGIAQAALVETRRRGEIQNAYYRIALPRVTLGVLVLEWAPRTSTVAWANEVLSRHAADRVIIVTHAYLYEDSTRYDHQTRGNSQLWSTPSYRMASGEARHDPENDGELLWNRLVRRHANVFLVLCGHVGGSGTGRLESRGDDGNVVQQVLANFQELDEGGLGYLRLFEIEPDGRSMRMKTYSPSLKLFATGDMQQAELPIEPALW